ncbi:MAG TPA: hypothetical protein VHS09_10420, partial [Polyangiaceae bacterium]|nr:hypothetical protein [Polyangiaceae bacterium]
MSDGKRPEVSWRTIERVADQAERDEMKNLLEMSDEELDADLAEAGVAPGDAARVVEAALAKAAAGAAAGKKVVSLSEAREKRATRRRPTWLLLVAAAVGVAVVGGGATVVAVYAPSPSSTSPVPTVPTAPPGPSPEQLAEEHRAKAEELRATASTECGGFHWRPCMRELESAKELDPGGDGARATQRLRNKADRGITEEDTLTKGAPGPRSIAPDARAKLVAALGAGRGQALHLVCARDGEAMHLCDQVAAALGKAGWVLTRSQVSADKDGPLGVRVEVSTGADDATQANADRLAGALEEAFLAAHGPDDMAAREDEASLRLTIGRQ